MDSKFPKTIDPDPDPDSEDRLFEKLSSDPEDFEMIDYIRRYMRNIYKEENNGRPGQDSTGSEIS